MTYVQFRDCIQETRSDLQEIAALRELHSKFELQVLKAAAAPATVPPVGPTTAWINFRCPPNFNCSFCLCTAGSQSQTRLSFCKCAEKLFFCFESS